MAVDVTAEIRKRREIETERDVDLLTGLYNRRGLDRRLKELFKEPEKLGYSVMIMIDADGLKVTNDTYGHDKGDIYLKKIGKIIEEFGTGKQVASRQGGDEFVLFLYHYDSEEELLKAIEELQYIQDNSSVELDENTSIPLRFSLGYSLTYESADILKLMKTADERMYANKLERRKNNRGIM